MSRAFVRETDDRPDELPERPVSAHPNYVTDRGLRQIEERVRELEQAREALRPSGDKTALARIERDLRYWHARRATARRVDPGASPDRVRFGMTVTLRYANAEERCYALVGEDEADPAAGRISWVSPVAHALLGREVGDEVALQGRSAEIVAIESPQRS